MDRQERIRESHRRTARALELRPARGLGTAVTRARLGEGFHCEVTDGKWTLTADMSEKGGGDGAGPDPGVYGRTALATCLTMVYARWLALAELAIDRLEVEIEADYDAGVEYGVAEGSPGYSQVRYRVTIETPEPDDRIRAVLDEAEELCPYLQIFRQPQRVIRDLRIDASEAAVDPAPDAGALAAPEA